MPESPPDPPRDAAVRASEARAWRATVFATVLAIAMFGLAALGITGPFSVRGLQVMGVGGCGMAVARACEAIVVHATADVSRARAVMGIVILVEAAVMLIAMLQGWPWDFSGLIAVFLMLGAPAVWEAREASGKR